MSLLSPCPAAIIVAAPAPFPNASFTLGFSPSIGFLVLTLFEPPEPPPALPFIPLETRLLTALNAAAPPTPAAKPPAVLALSNPNIFLNNFSDGIINAKNRIAKIGLLTANSDAPPRNIVYTIK